MGPPPTIDGLQRNVAGGWRYGRCTAPQALWSQYKERQMVPCAISAHLRVALSPREYRAARTSSCVVLPRGNVFHLSVAGLELILVERCVCSPSEVGRQGLFKEYAIDERGIAQWRAARRRKRACSCNIVFCLPVAPMHRLVVPAIHVQGSAASTWIARAYSPSQVRAVACVHGW